MTVNVLATILDNIKQIAKKQSGEISLEDSENEKASQSCEYFINQFVYIQDKDVPGGVVKFILWASQVKVLADFINHRFNIVLKARQLGLTWLALSYAVWRMIYNPGYTVVALSRGDTEAKELVDRVGFILKYLPKWMIQEEKEAKKNGWTGRTYRETEHEITIFHPGQEIANFQSFPAAKDSGRSFTASLVILDEWAFQMWAEEIWASAYPTINRPTGGQVIGLSTAKLGTFFEKMFWDAYNGLNDFIAIFLSWKADPRRDDAWYEQTCRNMPAHKRKAEYPNTPEEAFSAAQGMAFPEFDRDIHVCQPFIIPAHWKRWRAVDNGYSDPYWWGWFAVSEDGQVFLYKEFTREPEDEKLIYSDQAKKVVKMSKRVEVKNGQEIEVEENYMFTVAGVDAWNAHHRDQSGKSIIDYYVDGGLPRGQFIKAVTDRVLRKATLHEYLKPYEDKNTGKMTAKLQIFSTCHKVIDILPKLLEDEKDPEKVADDSAIDNPYDGLGYGLIAHHSKQTKSPKKELTGEAKRIHDHIEKLAKSKSKRNRKRHLM